MVLAFTTAMICLFLLMIYPNNNYFKSPVIFKFLQSPTSKTSECDRQFPIIFDRNMSTYRQCLLKNVDKTKPNLRSSLEKIISACLDQNLCKIFDVCILLSTDKDRTWIILPNTSNDSKSCVEVTLSVGQDIGAEEELLQLLPHCRLHGADPTFKNGEIFKKVGMYHEIGVSDRSGTIQASVKTYNGYENQNIKSVELVQFLNEYVKENPIDYLWIDNEGLEYKIFQKYFIDPSDLKIPVCQITVEMHGPMEKYGMNAIAYDDLILSMLSRSVFLPFVANCGGFVRAFYLNIMDSVCLENFFLRKFCPEF